MSTKYTNSHNVNNLFTSIEISQRQRHSPLNAFIRLLTLRYKGQNRAGNGNSQRIQSVLCEDALRLKRIIAV